MSSSTDEDYPWTDGSETWSTRGAFSQSPTEFDLIAEAFVSREPPKEVTAPAEHMTLRQQFVMAAIQGLCARSSGLGFAETIKSAIEIADAALAEEARTRSET